jgi:hypothetical protein
VIFFKNNRNIVNNIVNISNCKKIKNKNFEYCCLSAWLFGTQVLRSEIGTQVLSSGFGTLVLRSEFGTQVSSSGFGTLVLRSGFGTQVSSGENHTFGFLCSHTRLWLWVFVRYSMGSTHMLDSKLRGHVSDLTHFIFFLLIINFIGKWKIVNSFLIIQPKQYINNIFW